jgi:hypothetical protein
MKQHLEVLLICDGTSDAALAHPLRWLLSRSGYSGTLAIQTADFSRAACPPKRLEDKLEAGLITYKPDIIFVHRDAEKQAHAERLEEIEAAVFKVKWKDHAKAIPVIPVRMLESWLLIDETAIRRAAGNPNGKDVLTMPLPSRLEAVADPKALLCRLLTAASGLKGRRLSKFKPLTKRHLVAEEIADFSALDATQSFQHLANLVKTYLSSLDGKT